MKNELKLIIERDEDQIATYKVEDADTLYLITKNRSVADKVYKELKLEYKKGK
jgi:hypothetical protein